MRADRRMYLNKDKTKAVPEGNPEAASLLVATGQEVPKEYEELVKNMSDPDDSEVESKDAGNPPENKDAGNPPENKGGLTIEKSKKG